MKLEFIPLDYDYFDFNSKAYVRVWGKTSDGKSCCMIDSCDAYFYVIPKPKTNLEKFSEKIEKIELENAGRQVKIENVKIEDKKHLDKDVKALKVVVSNPKDIHVVVEKVKEMPETDSKREIDMNFITRYIIDKEVRPLRWYEIEGKILEDRDFGGISSILDVDIVIKAEKIKKTEDREFMPKAVALDIEADSFEIGRGNIVMLSMVSDNFRKVLTWKSAKKAQGKMPEYVEICKDEAEMLEKFVEYMKKLKPDILVTYFGDGFDLPYLRQRADKHKIKLDLGKDGSNINFQRGRINAAKITGVVHVDLFRFIETVFSQYMQSETLSLGEVASELIGETKHEFGREHAGKKTEHLEEGEWISYYAYNLQDSLLTEKLFRKIWLDMFEFSRVIGEPLFDICRDRMSQHVENYILHNLKKFNEIALNRPTHDRIEERMQRGKYKGAFVFQPQAGLYENLAVFDFTSYWPSIIVTYNLSMSTFLEKKELNSFEADVEKEKYYFSKKPGFFPLMLKEIINLRKKYKQEYKKDKNPLTKARSNAYKLLANASYGYQGFFGARYYCPEASAATTAISRDFIKKIIEKINNAGYRVIYADTDGVSFLLNEHDKKETMEFLERLNKELPGIMELELEDFYKRGLWVTKRTGEFGAKKKYALLNEEGKLKIRGFETVRRDWCNLAREVQDNVLDMILEEGKAEKSLVYVRKIIEELKKRKIEKNKLFIRTQLKKSLEEYKSESPHVTAAKKMLERGMPVDAGMLIEFYIAETRNKKALVREMTKLPDEKGEYNLDYYINHQILPAVENIFQVFGVSSDELKDGKKQKKLHEF